MDSTTQAPTQCGVLTCLLRLQGSVSKSRPPQTRWGDRWGGREGQKVKLPLEYCDDRVRILCADALAISPNVLADCVQHEGYTVILSDMCPAVSGISSRDATLSGELGMRALALALGSSFLHSRPTIIDQVDVHQAQTWQGLLQLGGNIVIKLLEGEESQSFPRWCKGYFRTTAWYRPSATRSASREIYFIGKQRLL